MAKRSIIAAKGDEVVVRQERQPIAGQETDLFGQDRSFRLGCRATAKSRVSGEAGFCGG